MSPEERGGGGGGGHSALSKAWDEMSPSEMKCPLTMPWLRNSNSSRIRSNIWPHIFCRLHVEFQNIRSIMLLPCFRMVSRVPSRVSCIVILVELQQMD